MGLVCYDENSSIDDYSLEVLDFSKGVPEPSELQLVCSLLDIEPFDLIEADCVECEDGDEIDDESASIEVCKLICEHPEIIHGKLILNQKGCSLGQKSIGQHLYFS